MVPTLHSMHNLCMDTTKSEDQSLDASDIRLIAALQRDAQATHQQIGELVHLSASQVSRRIQRLESTGVVRRYVALMEPERLGLGVRAVAYVTLTHHSGEEGLAFEQEVSQTPEVLDCYAVAGESDYVLQIVAPSLNTLAETVLRRLTRVKGVASIRSNIVLRGVKSSTELPLQHLGG